MGFPSNLVKIIMKCVTTVSFSILINGQAIDAFIPQRGLRQGDPLYPYLFILCVEVLYDLLTKGQKEGSFHGIQIAPNSPLYLICSLRMIVYSSASLTLKRLISFSKLCSCMRVCQGRKLIWTSLKWFSVPA